MNHHIISLFCDTHYRVDGKCDRCIGVLKHMDYIYEYEWTGADLNCIECRTMVMASGVRYCWDWGLN